MVFEISRREFLQVNVAAGLASLLPTLLRLPLWQDPAAAYRDTLRAIACTFFPHANVEDPWYDQAVTAIEAKCRSDPHVFETVKNGVALLDGACGGCFADAAPENCIEMLKAMERSDFFRVVYRETLEALYGSANLWKVLGREDA